MNKILEAEQMAEEAMKAKNREIIRLSRLVIDATAEHTSDLRALRDELMSAVITNPVDHETTWNRAIAESAKSVGRYINGQGLAQLNRRAGLDKKGDQA